ncbi:hypothetical protein BDZ89DRAFT_1063263 [Hymenopellis radicata]|nr:hypothetical protein BDZ89DRAFT_1063263 [Hymenopellis radicata]
MASMSFAQRLYASALPAAGNTSQETHPQPHRASTYQTPSVPPPVPDNYRHHQRATTYSSSFAVTNSARTSENLTSAPRSTPTVALVARAPVSPNGQQSFSAGNPRSPSHETPMPRHSNSGNFSIASSPPATRYQTQANPPLQQPTSPQIYSTGPFSPPPSHPPYPVHSPPMPPPQRPPSMQQSPPPPPRPPVMQQSPPPPPSIQQQSMSQTQRPLPTPYQNPSAQSNDRGLMTDVGKAVGSVALKSVGGALLGAITGGILSSDVVDGLSSIFSGMSIGGDTASIPGFDFSQLQAVAQGQPGADYQSVIDSILQTQQQQPQQQQQQQSSGSGIDYKAIISELMKIQKQSTHSSTPAYQPPVYHPPPAPAPIYNPSQQPNPYLHGQSQQTMQMLQYLEQQQLQAQQNLLDMMKAQNAAAAGYGAGPPFGENQSYYEGGQPSFGGNGHLAAGHGGPQHYTPAQAHGFGGHPYGAHQGYHHS